jgi:hypothetical protein
MSGKIRIDLKNIDDLKKLSSQNTVCFFDGPMKGHVAGIKTQGIELNCWFGEPKIMWDKKDFCEKVIVRIRDVDFQLISIRPYTAEEKREEEHTSLMYVLIDGAYKWEPNFLRG